MKEIRRRTPAGETIVGAVDFIDGKETNRRAIHEYVQEVIKRWENTNQFLAQVATEQFTGGLGKLNLFRVICSKVSNHIKNESG